MLQKGVVKTVTYYNPDNGYSVLKLNAPDSDKVFAAVGVFPPLTEGENLELEGEWVVHAVYGEQFKCSGYRVLPPETPETIERYLSSGIFKGVGPVQAKAVAEAFGLDTFSVLDNHPERLRQVKGMGRKKRENLLAQWAEKQSVREVMYFLQAYHLSLNLSAKIHRHYGDQAVKILKEDPYKLADDIWGIGFIKADEIARKMGFEQDSYSRIRAGLIYTLNRSAEEGHVYLSKEELLQNAQEILHCSLELIVYTLDNLQDNNAIYRDKEDRHYRPYLYYSEQGICRTLSYLLKAVKRNIPRKFLRSVRLEDRRKTGKADASDTKT